MSEDRHHSNGHQNTGDIDPADLDYLKRLTGAKIDPLPSGNGASVEVSPPSSSMIAREFETSELHLEAEPGPRHFVVEGLIPGGPYITILYAGGGTGKSYVLLLLAFLVALGRKFFGLLTSRCNVLWIDTEGLGLEEIARRGFEVARGQGLDRAPAGVYYWQATESVGSVLFVEIVRALVDALSIGFIILDSFTAGATGKDVSDVVDTVDVMQALMKIGTPICAVDHTTKAEAGGNQAKATAFGSVFKFNLARSVVAMTNAGSGVRSLVHKKLNSGGGLRPTLFFKMSFERDAVTGLWTVRFDGVSDSSPEMIGADEHMTGPDSTRYWLRWLYDNVSAGLTVTVDELERRTGFKTKTIENHISILVARKEARRVDAGSFLPLYPKEL